MGADGHIATDASRGRPRDLDMRPRPHGGVGPLLDLFFRVAYAAGFRASRVVWSLTRPTHQGALVAVLVGRSMLLLRQSYRPELSMPGGGVATGEDAGQAARRELVEELDLAVGDAELRLVHTETGLWDGRRDTVSFFELDLESLPELRLDNREVVGAGLVPFDDIDVATVTPAVGAYVRWRRACEAAAAMTEDGGRPRLVGAG